VAEQTIRTKPVDKANLLIDSTDFALRGQTENKKKDAYFSFKLNSLGRRYQMVMRLDQRIIFLRGGFSPKIYDSLWMETNKIDIKTNLTGGIIVGDCHYRAAKDHIDGVQFITPTLEPPKRTKNSSSDQTTLAKEKKSENLTIRSLRSRVEAPFGSIKSKFKALGKKFTEGDKQLDYAVTFAVGVFNFNL
jgi:hypothetical protein